MPEASLKFVFGLNNDDKEFNLVDNDYFRFFGYDLLNDSELKEKYEIEECDQSTTDQFNIEKALCV